MSTLFPSGPHDADLFAAEDGLITLYELRKSAGMGTEDIESAYSVLAAEMYRREILTKGLKVNGLPPEFGDKSPRKAGANAGKPDWDGDNDDQPGATDAGTDQGVGPSEARGGTEQQTPRPKAKQTDGPTVKKEESPPNAGKHPSKDDGLHTSDGTKSGKGGNLHRFEVHALIGSVPGEEDDPDNTGHDNVVPGGKAKQNKSPDSAQGRTVANKAAPAGETKTAQKPEGGAAAGGTSPAKPVPTQSSGGAPAKNNAPDDETDYTPHPFAPSEAIASICATCGRAIADHVGKFLNADESRGHAAYIVKEFTRELTEAGQSDPRMNVMLKRDFTSQERQEFAGNGVALPDGSFPIPDEASLHNGIRLVGHAADPQAAMQHIIERAKTMGMTHALPPAWNVADAGTESEDPLPGPGAHGMAPDQAQPGAAGGGAPKPAGSGTGSAPTKPKPAAAPAPSPSPSPTPSAAPMGKEWAVAFKKAYDAGLDVDAAIEVISAATAPEFEQYAFVKTTEDRYVLGPVYMPEQYDAHGEWTTARELQKALWEYVRKTGADRNIYLQHSSQPAGEWVEAMQWPYSVRATMQKNVGGVQKAVSTEFPAGTVYMGVIFKQWAWDLVKEEKATGFSMGGWAKRLDAEIQRLS